MKIKIAIVFFLMLNLLQAQDFEHFKLEVLIAQLPYANKEIKTKFHDDKNYYYDVTTNTKLFLKGFDIGYPFFLESALVRQNGKYGIIDKQGNFQIEPIYDTFKLAPYDHESYIVIFNDDVIFDLNAGKSNASYTICEEPASPMLYPFLGENKKFGVKEEGLTIIKAVYDTIYAVESEFIIAAKNNKIGLLNLKGEQLTKFEYDETQFSKDQMFDYTYAIFGLRKKNTWTYFEKGQRLINSKYKCTSFLSLLENSIGVFSKKGQENILFKNGKTLDKYYDYVSPYGLVGTIDNEIFTLNSDGSGALYFKEN